MRVLWFSVNSSCYGNKSDVGRGWVASLERIIRKNENIHLGIAFEYKSDKFKDTINNVDYYPISVCQNKIDTLKKEFTIEAEEKKIIPECIKIINDFKPDIIQCFGSEWCYGLVAKYVNIPVVIHMQGSMPSIYNALYPPKYSKEKKLFYEASRFNLKDFIRALFENKKVLQRTEREFRILKLNKYFLGRTDWDKSILKLSSPNSNYHTCNEVLRESFYDSNEIWKITNNDTITLCTTGSGSLWKGLDVILKTAKILKERANIKFRWKIIGGVSNIKYLEKIEQISFNKVNIVFTGILDEEDLKKELLNSDIYVHPSYIDNSPNALCEAMILGLPCIASYVGGIPSIISNYVNGILVPVNEPYYLAQKIIDLANNKELQAFLSKNASKSAAELHSKKRINNELIEAYNEIINDYYTNHSY